MRSYVISFRFSLVLLLSCFVLLTACGQSSSPTTGAKPALTPTVALDVYGTPIAFPTTAPQRIVSLLPGTSEMLGALHLQGRVVAVDYYTSYPPELASLPKVPDVNGKYNVEQIVAFQQLTALGQQFGQTCDGERLLALAREAPPLEQSSHELFPSMETTQEQVAIAIAQDEAFNFYYPDTLDLLRRAGAKLVPFSPVHDSVLPEHIAGIYIGGGFPEEYAQHLAANASMRAAVAQLLRKGMPCYAECGGLMYLCQAIRIASGEELPMVGAIARQSLMSSDREGLVIGYREATALRDTLLTRQGEVVRGHEFHYSSLNAPLEREEAAYEFTTRGQVEGFVQGNLLATYVHLSFSGFPPAAGRFVAAAKAWQVQASRTMNARKAPMKVKQPYRAGVKAQTGIEF